MLHAGNRRAPSRACAASKRRATPGRPYAESVEAVDRNGDCMRRDISAVLCAQESDIPSLAVAIENMSNSAPYLIGLAAAASLLALFGVRVH